jgi:tRNA pseudouridine synthase 9
VLQQRDLLEHSLHRHEPPVSAAPVTIVRDDGDVVVVDKPASIPVCCAAC